MKESGSMGKKLDMVPRSLLMVTFISGSLLKASQMAMEPFDGLMVIPMKENL